MVTIGKSFLPLLIIIAQLVPVVEGFAPISLHYYCHHLLLLCKLQGGVCRCPPPPHPHDCQCFLSISLFAVNNNDDDK